MSPLRRRLRALLTTTLGLAVVLSPLAITSPSAAADPKHRVSSAPEVFFPLVGSGGVKDRKDYTPARGYTRITAPCGKSVRTSTPGTVSVYERTVRGATRYVVRVRTGADSMWAGYSYLSRVSVTDGQLVAAGQRLGRLGQVPGNPGCTLRFKVATGAKPTNASIWLDRYVGKAQPTARLFGSAGFTVSSFNILGANHTAGGGRKGYKTYESRLVRAFRLLDVRGVDVVGLQEYQVKQHDFALRRGYDKKWASYFYKKGKTRDTDNAILWRRDKFDLVEKHTFNVPYFRGTPRAKPAVLLREKATGRTAWFLNIHNPTSNKKQGNNDRWRAEALRIERQKVIDLRASGRPVLLLGDFNENTKAFCAMTAGKLMISPNSLPSMDCAMPRNFHSIDWIFGAGQVRFTSFAKDMYPFRARINDHPIILARAHLQD